MNFSKEEWVHFGQWVQPPLSACFWKHWGKNCHPTIPLSRNFAILHGHSFITKQDYATISAFIKKVVQEQSPDLLKELETWVDAAHETVLQAIPSKASSKDISPLQALQAIEQSYEAIVTPWIFFLILDDPLTGEMKKICKQNGYDFDAIREKIRPLRKSFAVQQHEAAQRLYGKLASRNIDSMSQLEKYRALANEVRQHIVQFAFCGAHHFVGMPYSIEQFFENKKIPQKENKQQESKQQENKQQQNKNLLPPSLNWIGKLAEIAMFARTHMAESSGMLQHAMKPMLEKINEKLSLTEGEYIWHTLEELQKGLEGNPLPVTDQRKYKHGAITIDGQEQLVHGNEVDELLHKFILQETALQETIKELKGMIASKGKITGKAKIVVDPTEISKIEKGDILIAPETSPDYLIGIKRAGGIVTEVGGITSHAAIISRELGIPCIIGVKQITRMLKDGDIIELDAEKGIVRKLEST